MPILIADKFAAWQQECDDRFNTLKAHLALARIALDLDDGVKVSYEKLQTDADGKKHEDTGAAINGSNIAAVCNLRKRQC